VTDPTETDSGCGAGSISGAGGSAPATNSNLAQYATGNIGGYPLANWQGTRGVHTDGSNFLAVDGHVKWLRAVSVSGDLSAADANTAEVHNTGSNAGLAAGTISMTQQSGAAVSLTFSAI
jgi:prepilin-type processing-associated H-X9-DG protein